ncbi:MAG: hypothetical protein ACK5OB_19120, partial [Pirellula sp.]
TVMRVSKNQVTLLSAAVAALFAASAQAQVTVNNTPTAVPALVAAVANYANEIALGTGLTLGAASVTDFSLQGSLGFGLQAGDVRYIRLDYTGASFLAAGAPATLAFAGGTCAANSFIVLGGASSSSVIYQINATANCAAANVFTLTSANGMLVTSKTPTVTYSLYQDSAGAAQQLPTSRLVQGAATPLVNFTNALVFTMNPVVQEIAAATTNFSKFCATGFLVGTAGCASGQTDTGAIVGQVNQFRLVTPAPKRQDGTVLTQMTEIATGASLVVTGNFAAAGTSVATMTTNGCGAGATPSAYAGVVAASTGATVTYPNGTSGTTGLLNTTTTSGIEAQHLCYNVPTTNTVAITPQTYTATMNLTPATAAYVTPSIVRDSGQIIRDGVEFQSPWFNFSAPAYNTRFFLTNTGTADAVCSVALMSETGNTLTAGSNATVTVPGTTTSGNANGGVLLVTTASIVASASVANRGAVRFICSAPSAAMQGTFVTTNNTTGDFTNTPMLRPTTN